MSPFVKDTIERVAWTFLQGFAGVLVASGVLEASVIQAAGIAGVMAVFSLIKSLAASRLGTPGTAQLGTSTYSGGTIRN